MAVRFPHVGHSHGHSHSSLRHRAAIQLTLYCDAPRNTRYVSLYCPTRGIHIHLQLHYYLFDNYCKTDCRLSLFSGANCPVHPAYLYLDGHSVLTWMLSVCRAPAVWISPPLSRSIFFFYFTYTSFLVESALSLQAQIPVTLYSMRRSALSNCPFLCLHFHTRRCPCSPLLPLFSSAAVDLRWLIYWPASPPFCLGYRSILLISSHSVCVYYTTKSQTFLLLLFLLFFFLLSIIIFFS